MDDHPLPDDVLRTRARRGTGRGPEAVLAAARSAAAGAPDLLDAPASRRAERHGRRWAAAAAAVIVVGLLAGVAVLEQDRTDVPAAPGDTFCVVLAEPAATPSKIDADVVVYIEPGAGTADREPIGSELRASGLVDVARYVDQTETYERFRKLFRGEPGMLVNVRPEDLPTSFEVDLVPGWTDEDAAAFIAGFRARPNVFEVHTNRVPRLRVLDLLALAGLSPDLVAAVEADLADRSAGDAWRAQIDTAAGAAPAQVADAISLLAGRLTDRVPPAIDGPEARSGIEAASTLTAAAATRCDLHVPAFLTGNPSEDSTTTTAPGGD